MTVKELKSLRALKLHIERMERRIKRLEESADIHSPDISGKPRNPSQSNKLDDIVPDIADEKTKLALKRAEYKARVNEIESYIYSIENENLRLIFLYRYVDMLNWQQVADKIGGNCTEASVRQAHSRYLKKI